MADTATPKPRKSPAAPRKRTASKKAPPPKVWRPVLIAAGLVFLLDQALKYLVVHVLQLDRVREIDVLDPWLNLRMAWNQGMNFGLFASDVDVMRWVLVGIAVAVCLWVVIWVGRAKPRRFALISAGILIGGALGNVVDRMMYGAVADFLNMSLPGWRNPYSFNVADIAIFLGAMGLVLQPPEKQPQKSAGQKSAGQKSAGQKARTAPARPRKPKATDTDTGTATSTGTADVAPKAAQPAKPGAAPGNAQQNPPQNPPQNPDQYRSFAPRPTAASASDAQAELRLDPERSDKPRDEGGNTR